MCSFPRSPRSQVSLQFLGWRSWPIPISPSGDVKPYQKRVTVETHTRTSQGPTFLSLWFPFPGEAESSGVWQGIWGPLPLRACPPPNFGPPVTPVSFLTWSAALLAAHKLIKEVWPLSAKLHSEHRSWSCC